MTLRPHRRDLLRAGALLGGTGLSLAATTRVGLAGTPALLRSGRPAISHGVQSGDAVGSTATVWARADRPAQMLVEVADAPSFARARLVRGPVVTPESDLTASLRINGLRPGRETYYRVRFADLTDGSLRSEPVVGQLRIPSAGEDIRFLWSGDLAGQGFGINPDLGGYRIFEAMRRRHPDFFLFSGDTVYSDGPLASALTLPGGRVWRNIVTEEKSRVAETLDEYRGQFRYNLLDDNLRRFFAEVPQVNQWDDHEVRNNWYPGQILDDPRYQEQRVDVLARRAARAFHEYTPITAFPDDAGRVYRKLSYGRLLDVFVLDMRTHKDPNTPGRETTPDGGVLGERQLRWLKQELVRSRATWKVIANDLPLGLVVPDGANMEGLAQGDPGAPLGRELEIAELLRFAKHRRVRNMVWLTADVHYTAAHYYDPARATFGDFDPFWEFVSGPLNAGAFGPNALDATFGPQPVFVAAPPAANTSPAEGFQFFGEVAIDGGSEALTVTLRDQHGAGLWTTTLHPAGG